MSLLFCCKVLFYFKVLFYCKVNPLYKKLTIFKTPGKRLLKFLENTMNVTNVLEEEIALFIAPAKISDRERSISPCSFYG